MEKWKAVARRLLFLPVGVMVLCVIISAAALIMVFVKNWEAAPIAYAVYVFSFYTLVTVCIACVVTFPAYYQKWKQKVYENPLGNRYLTDAAFKTHVSLHGSFAINLLYVAVNLLSGIRYHTTWFLIFAVYYSILAGMRFLLLRYVNRNEIGHRRLEELRRSRLCASILLAINLVLTAAVLMILYQDRGFEYHGVLIYVMALYTFYTTTVAVINIVKYRKYNSPILTTAKVINLAAALVSMLALETAMFSQFGAEMSLDAQKIMIIATGAGISSIVVAMAGYIIVQATKEIRRTV